jgi:hypothetical protein
MVLVTDKKNMKTSNHLKTIYDSVALVLGETKAREYIATTMSNLLYDLKDNLTDESLENALREEAEFCKSCASKNVAS